MHANIAWKLKNTSYKAFHNAIFTEGGTDNEHWLGDTVKLTLTKVSGESPIYLSCVIGTEAKYSD